MDKLAKDLRCCNSFGANVGTFYHNYTCKTKPGPPLDKKFTKK
jgi:hypothetical protein